LPTARQASAAAAQGGDVTRWLRDLVVRRVAHVLQHRAQLAVDLVVLPAHRGEFGAQLPEKGAELPLRLAGQPFGGHLVRPGPLSEA
jgi:hypothetical protein